MHIYGLHFRGEGLEASRPCLEASQSQQGLIGPPPPPHWLSLPFCPGQDPCFSKGCAHRISHLILPRPSPGPRTRECSVPRDPDAAPVHVPGGRLLSWDLGPGLAVPSRTGGRGVRRLRRFLAVSPPGEGGSPGPVLSSAGNPCLPSSGPQLFHPH